MATYKKIFSINIPHEYYDLSYVKDFDLVPTQETEEVLRNHKVVIRNISQGIIALAKAEEDPNDGDKWKMTRPFEAAKLSFNMVLNNPYFQNFSDLPIDGNEGKVFSFNNAVQHSLPADPTKKLVATYVTGTDNVDRILKAGPVIKLTTAVVNDEIRVKDAVLGTEVYYHQITSDDLTNGEFQIDLRKQNAPSGRFKVWINAVSGSPFYYNADIRSQGIFGTIDIYVHNESPYLVPEANRVIDVASGEITEQDFELPFNHRSTTWKYIIDIQSHLLAKTKYDELADAAAGSMPEMTMATDTAFQTAYPSVAFVQDGAPVKKEENNGRRILVFKDASNDTLPVKQSVIQGISLSFDIPGDVFEGTSTPIPLDVLRTHMPNAPITSLNVDRDVNGVIQNIYSEISVQV